MAAAMEHIFPSSAFQTVEIREHSQSQFIIKTPPNNGTPLLLSGKHEKLLTSLLQQAVVSYSVECKLTVFIRPEPLSELPYPVHGMYQMNYATVQNIRYLYLRSAEALITYLCGLNNSQADVPKAIIIDGLDFYIQQLQYGSEVSICKLSSHLVDTIQYLNKRHCETTPLLVSINDTLVNHLQIYKRFFDIYSLTEETGGDKSSYILERLRTTAIDDVERYHLTLTDSICLKSIESSHHEQQMKDSL